MLAAVVAMLLANSPAAGVYAWLFDMPVEIRVGPLQIAKPLLMWVNDGLMAIFFFLVGLELKRELIDGELSKSGTFCCRPWALSAEWHCRRHLCLHQLGRRVALAGWAILPLPTSLCPQASSLLGNRRR